MYYFIVNKNDQRQPLNIDSDNKIVPMHEYGLFDTTGWREEKQGIEYLQKHFSDRDDLMLKRFFANWIGDTYTFRNITPFEDVYVLSIKHPNLYNHYDLYSFTGSRYKQTLDEIKTTLKSIEDMVTYNEENHIVRITFKKGQRKAKVIEALKKLQMDEMNKRLNKK